MIENNYFWYKICFLNIRGKEVGVTHTQQMPIYINTFLGHFVGFL